MTPLYTPPSTIRARNISIAGSGAVGLTWPGSRVATQSPTRTACTGAARRPAVAARTSPPTPTATAPTVTSAPCGAASASSCRSPSCSRPSSSSPLSPSWLAAVPSARAAGPSCPSSSCLSVCFHPLPLSPSLTTGSNGTVRGNGPGGLSLRLGRPLLCRLEAGRQLDPDHHFLERYRRAGRAAGPQCLCAAARGRLQAAPRSPDAQSLIA